MRVYHLTLAIALFLLSPAISFSQTTKDISEAEARAHAARKAFKPTAATSTYDVVYQRAEWTIDPAIRYIRGAVTTHFQPLNQPLSQLWFDLDNSLRVDSVYYRKQKIAFEQTPEKLLRLDIGKALTANTLDSVTVFYQGTPPTTGYGSFEQRLHNQVPVIWTLSEPYGARDWWPCKQSLTDKIDSLDIIIYTPLGNKAASNGKLIAEKQLGQQMVYHWQHRYPIVTYLVALAVTNYVAFEQQVPHENGEVQILNYVYPESEAQWRTQAPQITGMMQLFNKLFGLYPFANEKYGHAQFSWGGGMEHQTMSFMVNLSYDLMAHELAHQWFGDKVTVGSWQDIWVNEGFATYLTGLTKEHLGTPSEWRSWKAQKISNITAQPDGAVWVSDTTSVDRIFNQRLSYNKGAYLLHMLRWITGDEAFFSGIRNYLNDPKLAYGHAGAADVKRHLEASSGKNLDEFFNDWYYGEGYPVWSINYTQQGRLVTLSLSQNTSAPQSVPFFEMPIPILFRNSTGTQEALHVIDHTHQQQEVKIELPFEVAETFFDPHLWLLTKGSTINGEVTGLAEQLAHKLSLYPNPSDSKIILEAIEGLSLEQVLLLSVKGQQLQSHAPGGKLRLELDVRNLPSGNYLLRIKTNQGWTTKRFTR